MTTRAPVPASEQNVVVYPVASAGAAVTAGAANTYGAYAELVAPATIASAFRIVGVFIGTPSAGEMFTISLASGADGAEAQFAEIPCEIATDAGGYLAVPIFSKTIAANERIAGRIKTIAGATTAALRVMTQIV